MQATLRESDWCNRIQTCQVSKAQKALDVYQTLSSFWGWGLGTRLTNGWYVIYQTLAPFLG